MSHSSSLPCSIGSATDRGPGKTTHDREHHRLQTEMRALGEASEPRPVSAS